ncbi:MAG: XRE family transcriptional regulator [Alphaproteobacteria bacterium]|nr:XRE family transcriptional regulator [Alphaproteobacteria bacterium]
MSSLEKIGKRIAACRKQRKLTQEDLAGLTEMDRSYLSEVENGHKNISVLALLKILKVLKVSAAEILD